MALEKPVDLFKAIFEDNDSSSEEEEEEPDAQQLSAAVSNTTTAAATATATAAAPAAASTAAPIQAQAVGQVHEQGMNHQQQQPRQQQLASLHKLSDAGQHQAQPLLNKSIQQQQQRPGAIKQPSESLLQQQQQGQMGAGQPPDVTLQRPAAAPLNGSREAKEHRSSRKKKKHKNKDNSKEKLRWKKRKKEKDSRRSGQLLSLPMTAAAKSGKVSLFLMATIMSLASSAVVTAQHAALHTLVFVAHRQVLRVLSSILMMHQMYDQDTGLPWSALYPSTTLLGGKPGHTYFDSDYVACLPPCCLKSSHKAALPHSATCSCHFDDFASTQL